jgi:hypothetical protein
MIYELIHYTIADRRTIGYFPKRKVFRMLRGLAELRGAENLSLVLVPESSSAASALRLGPEIKTSPALRSSRDRATTQ